jgi:hypothetical protein
MTSPAITIYPDAPLSAAARLINAHHIRRLPVVNAAGDLIGIVSRRDLIKVFLRPDEEISAGVNEAFSQILLEDAGQIAVCVRDGVVTLDGEFETSTWSRSRSAWPRRWLEWWRSSTGSPTRKHTTGIGRRGSRQPLCI